MELLLISGGIVLITLLGYLFPRSKGVFLLEIIQLIILLGGYNGAIDLVHYKNVYTNEIMKSEMTERLYNVLSLLFHRMGFSFESYHFIITVLAIGLIAYVVNKLSKEPALSMSLIVGYCTLEYAWQLKTMIAASIVVFALYCLRKYRLERRWKKYILYLLLILLAVQFQFSTIFFLVFLAMDYISFKEFKYGIIVAVGGIWVLLDVLLNIAAIYIPTLESYISHGYRNPILVLGYCFWHLSSTIIICWSVRTLRRKRIQQLNGAQEEGQLSATKQLDQEISQDVFIYKGNLLMLMAMPFYSVTTVADRLIRIWFLFCWTYPTELHRTGAKVSLPKSLVCLYSVASTVFFHFIISYFTRREYTFMEDNLFVEAISHNIFFQGG